MCVCKSSESFLETGRYYYLHLLDKKTETWRGCDVTVVAPKGQKWDLTHCSFPYCATVLGDKACFKGLALWDTRTHTHTHLNTLY